jgi:arylsulfatase A-like enzyme
MKPNIILINCDDLGWGDLGCTGHPQHKTPHLDSLAAEGSRFTDFYQASSLCSPSRGAMLTGCHPCRIGFDSFEGRGVLFPGQGVGLAPKEETFADVLRRAGYSTNMVGKWHCGDQPEFLPTNHGFDTYYGLPYSNDMGIQRPDSPYPPLPLLRGTEVVEAQPDQRSLIFRYTEECTKIIRANRDRPFLLYMAHMHVHLPHYVAEKFLADSPNGRYGGAVAAIDWSAGVILNELRALGLEDNTMVVFTSDNGSRCDYGPSNGPLHGTKNSPWEGGLRVPFLVRWKHHVPAGRTCDAMLTGMDLLPTFAALAGVEPQKLNPIDGLDASSLLLGKKQSAPLRELLPYYQGPNLDAVRRGKWKLYVARHGRDGAAGSVLELYDLVADPGEIRNVAAGNPNIVAQLQQDLEAFRLKFGDAATQATGNERRPVGGVDNPVPLTRFDPEHPYYMAMYDINEAG